MNYQTKRLQIRDLNWDDLTAIHAFRSDPIVTQYNDFESHTLAETRAWLAGCIHHNTIEPRTSHNCAIVLAHTGATIGWIGFGSPSESKAEWGDVDFGYALRQEFWGQGYMSEALTGLITFIFTTTAAQAIFGECEVANPASARVMQHARMQQVAHVSESDEATGKVIESLRFQIKKPDWQSLKPGQSHA